MSFRPRPSFSPGARPASPRPACVSAATGRARVSSLWALAAALTCLPACGPDAPATPWASIAGSAFALGSQAQVLGSWYAFCGGSSGFGSLPGGGGSPCGARPFRLTFDCDGACTVVSSDGDLWDQILVVRWDRAGTVPARATLTALDDGETADFDLGDLQVFAADRLQVDCGVGSYGEEAVACGSTVALTSTGGGSFDPPALLFDPTLYSRDAPLSGDLDLLVTRDGVEVDKQAGWSGPYLLPVTGPGQVCATFTFGELTQSACLTFVDASP